MNINLSQYAELCEWAPTAWLIVSENVFDPLIYYSHLVPILLSLPLALFIYWQDRTQRLNQYFLLTVLLFSIWTFGDLILWASDSPNTIMFVWSLLILLEPLIYISAFLFAYTALYRKPIPLYKLVLLTCMLLPTALLLPTSLAIESFNLTNCWREVTEGPLVYYGYLVQVIIALMILGHSIYYAITTTETKKIKQRSILAAIATLFFLAVFSSGNILGSFFENWTIGQYGIFGMPIMIAFMGFLITHYRIFKSKIFTAELLVGALGILTIGILFVQKLYTVRIVSIITFALVVVLGTILVRSVRREIEQRRQIEELAAKLEKANKRLRKLDQMKSEFVSIASHQLRSPLTSIRGYASMLLEGSYGKVPAKARGALERIAEASRYMALSVEDYLNVSRIESGNMKYEMSVFDLKKLASEIVNELRPVAIKRGLALTFKSKTQTKCLIKADIGKTKQIIQNLIDNSMKYTPKGSVNLILQNDDTKKRVYFNIVDTGIGMSVETLHSVFEKFERAHNANNVNVTGTGLGLYIARTMARAMKGDVYASSEGEGKGSTFTIEFPLESK